MIEAIGLPVRPARELRLVIGRIDEAAAAKADIVFEIVAEFVPQPHRHRRQRQFARVAVLLPAPAPVAARLFAGDMALFDERDRNAPPREEIGGGNTDDPAPHDDDIGGCGQRLVAVYAFDKR